MAGNNVPQRVDRPQDGSLHGREYFYVKQRDPLFKYPDIPPFHHWRFPHDSFDENGAPRGNLALPWENLRLLEFVPPRPTLKSPAAAMDRDITCRVSGYMDGVEKAHLVPEGGRFWFVSNKMDSSTDETDNSSVANGEAETQTLRGFDVRSSAQVLSLRGPRVGVSAQRKGRFQPGVALLMAAMATGQTM